MLRLFRESSHAIVRSYRGIAHVWAGSIPGTFEGKYGCFRRNGREYRFPRLAVVTEAGIEHDHRPALACNYIGFVTYEDGRHAAGRGGGHKQYCGE